MTDLLEARGRPTGGERMTKDELLALTVDELGALSAVKVDGDPSCTDCTRCTDCTYCTGIIGGRFLKYVAYGVQLTREEYAALVAKRKGEASE